MRYSTRIDIEIDKRVVTVCCYIVIKYQDSLEILFVT